MAALEFSVSEEGGESKVSVAFLPDAKIRVLHANRAILPIPEPHNIVVALVQFEGSRQALEEAFQMVLELGQRNQFMRLQKLGKKRK